MEIKIDTKELKDTFEKNGFILCDVDKIEEVELKEILEGVPKDASEDR